MVVLFYVVLVIWFSCAVLPNLNAYDGLIALISEEVHATVLLTACNLSNFVGVRFPLCAFHLLRHLILTIFGTSISRFFFKVFDKVFNRCLKKYSYVGME